MVFTQKRCSGSGALNDFKIKKLLLDNQELHSEFQIENFIIKSQNDEWMQYKQCLWEISGRIESISAKKHEVKLLKLDIKKFRICFPSKYHIEKRKIEKEQKQKRLKVIYDTISEYERELSRFVKHASELKAHFGDINRERRQQLELESWTSKGLKLMAIDILSTGAISKQTYEFVFSLPKDQQIKIFKALASYQPMEILGFSQDEIKQISPKRKEQLK